MGLPIANDNQSTSFFLGLSSLFGRMERIILTGGLMTGKRQELANGFKVGEAFDTNLGVALPLEGTYKLGGFIGLSFSFL